MKKLFFLLVFLFLTLSCVPAIRVNQEILNSAGRFVQLRNPSSGDVAVQITLPNKDICQMALEAFKHEKRNIKTSSKYISCSNNSGSSSLPFRATIRDKNFNYLMDIETTTFNFCEVIIEGLVKNNNQINELVSPCQKKH